MNKISAFFVKCKFPLYMSVCGIIILLIGSGFGVITLLTDNGPQGLNKEISTSSAYGNLVEDVRGVASFSDIIVEGNVEKVLDSRWPTEDGKGPENIGQVQDLREKGIDDYTHDYTDDYTHDYDYNYDSAYDYDYSHDYTYDYTDVIFHCGNTARG
jgi:hypothetical protein